MVLVDVAFREQLLRWLAIFVSEDELLLLIPEIGHYYALSPIKKTLKHVDSLSHFALLSLLGRGLLLATSLRYHDSWHDNIGVFNTYFRSVSSGLSRLTTCIGGVVFITGIRSPCISVLAILV